MRDPWWAVRAGALAALAAAVLELACDPADARLYRAADALLDSARTEPAPTARLIGLPTPAPPRLSLPPSTPIPLPFLYWGWHY